MESNSRSRAPDALAVATLLATGTVVAWPIISGGYLTYLDNPAHIAEVYATSYEARNGWSEIAFCGFPIATLHSPLWYGFLSFLARIGAGVSFPYVLCVWLGFTAPALAVYSVARKSLYPLPATCLAYVLMVQRPVIVGIGSAMGGMWTFFIAAAALILLIDRLSRPFRTLYDAGAIAALTGFVLLTHLYTIVPLVLLALVHVVRVVVGEGGDRYRLLWQATAAALGVAAAALYWAPLIMAGDATLIHPQNLDAAMIVARLTIPTEVFDLLNRDLPPFSVALVVESLPMVALVAAGIAGAFSLRMRANDVPLYGILLAATLLTLLLFVVGEFDLNLLGPGSWRMLYFVRVGLALAAIPFMARAANANLRRPRWVVMTAAVAAVAAGVWFGNPLTTVATPIDSAEMDDVEALWNWLAKNRDEDWGRVYLQDTFELPRTGVKLSQSHVLALTSHRTGVRQLGAFYGVAPYRTAGWTPSEFGTLFRKYVRDKDVLRRVQEQMLMSNSTHLVTSDPRTRRQVEESEDFEQLNRIGRFAVFRVARSESQWVSPLNDGVEVTVNDFRTGRIRLDVRSSRPGANVLVKSSFHPWWRVSGTRTGRGSKPLVRMENSGLMRLEGLRAGSDTIEMEYRPDRRPVWVSLFGWLVILTVTATGRGRRKAAIDGYNDF